MDFSNYKFRCSALGKIVSPSGKQTDTIKTYLRELFISEKENFQKDISSKYFEKGKYCEEDGFDLLQNTIHKGQLVLKNKERLSNDFIQGEYDTKVSGIVYDIKNAYDRFTFGKASLTHDYKWQGVGYMWLTNLTHFRLFYCLNNMPEHLLIDEEKKLYYKGGFLTFESLDFCNACEELRAFHNYNDKPLWERFKVWDVLQTEEQIERIKSAVIDARLYLNLLNTEHEEQINYNKKLMGI